MFYDDEHSADEVREFIVGYSNMNRLLVVYFTQRENKRLRIFSARKPTNIEREDYEENEKGREHEMKSEYRFDYSKARPNRFAEEYNRSKRTVILDADVAEDFPSSEAVNEALRFLARITKEHKGELTQK